GYVLSDVAVTQVVLYEGSVTGRSWSVSSAAADLDLDYRARRHGMGGRLPKDVLVAVRQHDAKEVRPARITTSQPPGRGTGSFNRTREVGILEHSVTDVEAEPPSEATGPARVGCELEAFDEQWVAKLQRFDGGVPHPR